MKSIYSTWKGIFFALCLTAFSINQSKATDLNAGELLFTGYHSNGSTSCGFSFVILVNLSGTTIVSFTDNGWLSTNVFRTGEQTITWTYTGTLVAGREITIYGPRAGAATAVLHGSATTIGTCTGSNPSFATSGDQVIAYRGSVSSPTLIAGLHMNVYSTDLGQCGSTTNAGWDPPCITDNANFSTMPLGLAAGVSATWIGIEGVGASEQDNAKFICGGNPILTAAQVRAAVTNSANWTANSVAPPNFQLPSQCPYLGLVGLLPLKLLNFQGNSNGNSVELTWQTHHEENHSHFEIEKSADGRNFYSLARVNALGGFSYLPFDYNYRDALPASGANFYRLKMVAADGSNTYSQIVKVIIGKDEKKLLISPNPAVNEVTISVNSTRYNQLIITDMTGRIVYQSALRTNNIKVDISKFNAGQYLVTLAGNEERLVEKMSVTK